MHQFLPFLGDTLLVRFHQTWHVNKPSGTINSKLKLLQCMHHVDVINQLVCQQNCWTIAAPSISPRFYGWIGRGESFQHGITAEVLDSIPPDHVFSSAARNNSHLPCCLLSTHMTRAHSRDSHAGGGMLDYSIRDSLASSISPRFYCWTR
jgi:hypothetical protein